MQHYLALKAHGNCDIPQRFEDKNGLKLGKWVYEQRRQKRHKNTALTTERMKKLEELDGWTWESERKWCVDFVLIYILLCK